MLLLEQNTTRKEQVDNKVLSESEKELEFETEVDKKYEFQIIIDSMVYG